MFQEHTKTTQFIIISPCNVIFVCFRNAQRTFSLSSSLCVTACLYVSGMHKERAVHHHLSAKQHVCYTVCFKNTQRTFSSSPSLCITACLYVSGTHKEHSVRHHLTKQHPVCFRNAQRTLSSSSSLYVTTCLSWQTGWSASTRRTTAPSPSPSTPIACSSLFRKSTALPKCLLVRLRAVDDADLVPSIFRGNRQNFSLCKYPKFCCSANTL